MGMGATGAARAAGPQCCPPAPPLAPPRPATLLRSPPPLSLARRSACPRSSLSRSAVGGGAQRPGAGPRDTAPPLLPSRLGDRLRALPGGAARRGSFCPRLNKQSPCHLTTPHPARSLEPQCLSTEHAQFARVRREPPQPENPTLSIWRRLDVKKSRLISTGDSPAISEVGSERRRPTSKRRL